MVVVRLLAPSHPPRSPISAQLERRIPLPTDFETFKASIDQYLADLRPKIEAFLTKPDLPTWLPPESGADEKTREFYQELGIPLVNGKPNLLLHQLDGPPNPYVDTLFKSGKHW